MNSLKAVSMVRLAVARPLPANARAAVGQLLLNLGSEGSGLLTAQPVVNTRGQVEVQTAIDVVGLSKGCRRKPCSCKLVEADGQDDARRERAIGRGAGCARLCDPLGKRILLRVEK